MDFATVALFEELTRAQNSGTHTGYVFGQSFDVSYNLLSGSMPAFLLESNVPSSTQLGVRVQVRHVGGQSVVERSV